MNENYENLINSLISDGYLKTPLLIEAFKNIDRQDFVTEEYKNSAYVNEPLPIGFEQTISQPLTVAFLMELLEPKPGEKILDIGAGSGWTSAILAYVTSGEWLKSKINPSAGGQKSKIDEEQGGKGLVIGIECIPELKEFAEKNLAKYGFIEKGIVKLFSADGVKGYKKEAPYDKIIAGAAAKGDVPAEWKKQLKIGGRIVAPVGNSVVVIDKTGKGKYSRKEHFGFSFVPLISDK